MKWAVFFTSLSVLIVPAVAMAQVTEWRPDLIAKYESNGGQNVPNFRFDGVDGRHSAGGVCQMLTSTWLRVAKSLDIDTAKFPAAGTADEFTQWQACWKLWSVEGYHPWTCNGCNAKLRKILGTPAPTRRLEETAATEKPKHEMTRVEAFNARLSASSEVYSAMPIAVH